MSAVQRNHSNSAGDPDPNLSTIIPLTTNPDLLVLIYLAVKRGIEVVVKQIKCLQNYLSTWEVVSYDLSYQEYCERFQLLHILAISMHNLYRSGIKDKLLVSANFKPHPQLSFAQQYGSSFYVKDLLASSLSAWKYHIKNNGIPPEYAQLYGNVELEMCSIRYLRACLNDCPTLRSAQYGDEYVLSKASLEALDDKIDRICANAIRTSIRVGFRKGTSSKAELYLLYRNPLIVFNTAIMSTLSGLCTTLTHSSSGATVNMYSITAATFNSNLYAVNKKIPFDQLPAPIPITLTTSTSHSQPMIVSQEEISQADPSPANIVSVSPIRKRSRTDTLSIGTDSSDTETCSVDETPIEEDEHQSNATINNLCDVLATFVKQKAQLHSDTREKGMNYLMTYLSTQRSKMSLYESFLTICKSCIYIETC